MGTSKTPDPMDMKAAEFNRATEAYYRQSLRLRHTEEALSVLEQSLGCAVTHAGFRDSGLRETLNRVLDGTACLDFVRSVTKDVVSETASEENLIRLIDLVLIVIHQAGIQSSRGRNLRTA